MMGFNVGSGQGYGANFGPGFGYNQGQGPNHNGPNPYTSFGPGFGQSYGRDSGPGRGQYGGNYAEGQYGGPGLGQERGGYRGQGRGNWTQMGGEFQGTNSNYGGRAGQIWHDRDRRPMGRGREYGTGSQGQSMIETERLKEMEGKLNVLMELARKNQN